MVILLSLDHEKEIITVAWWFAFMKFSSIEEKRVMNGWSRED